jgi:hypothetical protein
MHTRKYKKYYNHDVNNIYKPTRSYSVTGTQLQRCMYMHVRDWLRRMCAKVAHQNDFHRMNNSLICINFHQFLNEYAFSFCGRFLNERYWRINWAIQFLNPSFIIFRHTYTDLVLRTCGHLHNAVFVKTYGNLLPSGLSYSLKRTSP